MNRSKQALMPPLQDSVSVSSTRSVRMAIRVWIPSQSNPDWNSNLPAIQMISDLVSASDGTFRQGAKPGLVAYFSDASQAFRATKRMQWALLDFCQRRPHLCQGAAAIIFQSHDLPDESDGTCVRAVAAVLSTAKPGQILAAATAGAQLRALPGLQMRDFTMVTGHTDWQDPVNELVWTSSSNLDRAQEVLHGLVKNFEHVDAQVASQPTMDFASAGKRVAPPTLVHTEPLPKATGADQSEAEYLIEELENKGKRSTVWWVLAAVAVVAIIVAVVLIPQLRSKATATIDHQPTVVQPTSSQAPPAQVEPTIESKPTEAASPPPVPAAGDVQRSDVPKSNASPETSPPSRHQSSKPVTEFGGFTAKDIPRLIQMAQKDAGAGRYDEARDEFNVVLRLDPGNSEAKTGLRKVDLSEREAR